MKYKWNGKNRLKAISALLLLLCFLTGCDDSPSRPGDGFYSYTGYRDWWRIPLKYPYQIIITDAFQQGSLEKYDPTQNIADPNISSHSIIAEDATKVMPSDTYIAFYCENNKYGILIYQSEKILFFDDEISMQKYLKEKFPNESVLKFQSLKQCYDETWKHLLNSSEK